MGFGLVKEDKFEIIAILRGGLHKKTRLRIPRGGSNVITQLGKIDFERSVISGHGDIVLEEVQYFVLYSESGIVKFSARLEQTPSAGTGAGLSYFIPDMISSARQRQSQHFSFPRGYDFFCFGRYRDGGNYSLKVKNISQCGCALIVKNANVRFLHEDVVTKSAPLDFSTFGSLQPNSEVVDVIPINEFDKDSQLYSYHRVSCEFGSKNHREGAEVEKVIIKFLMSNRIRNL